MRQRIPQGPKEDARVSGSRHCAVQEGESGCRHAVGERASRKSPGDPAIPPELRGAVLSILASVLAPFSALAQTLAAPTINAVHNTDQALTVVWTAPSGVTGVTAYDVRFILTSADETVDANWTVKDDAWTSGGLHYLLDGLSNGVGYDVQVRAVTTADGAWSATSVGTPADPGSTRATAAALPLDLPLGAAVQAAGDVDWFKFTLGAKVGVVVYARSAFDTTGELWRDGGFLADSLIASNNDAGREPNYEDFLIWRTLDPGTYYVKVAGFGFSSGTYTVRVDTIVDTTSTADAEAVELGVAARGLIDPAGDVDYFSFTLLAETDVILRTGPDNNDLVGELLDSTGTTLVENDDGFLLGTSRQFLIRRKLAAGTYYIKVKPLGSDRSIWAVLRALRVNVLYSLHVDAVAEPGSATADALRLEFGAVAGGRIDSSSDADYFRIDLPQTRHVFARAVSSTVDIDGELLDGDGDPVSANIFEQVFAPNGPAGFTLAERLAAGRNYLKITRSAGAATGGYALRMVEDEAMDRVWSACSGRSTSFSDPLYGCQWHLRNRGQLQGTAGEDIRVEEVWAGGNMGAGIGVAVVDSGLHEGHPDLVDNVDTSRGRDYTTAGHGLLLTFDSHGTSVAGIVAARDNGLGGRGVAPRATVYGYNYLSNATVANLVDAMTRNMLTTAVSNNSYGRPDGPGLSEAFAAWSMAVDTAVTSGYGGRGVFHAWTAGNGGELGDYANFEGRLNHYGVTPVCSVNDQGARVLTSERGANLWICAPSKGSGRPGILTTLNYGRYRPSFSGTSASAPIVAGAVALVRAANTKLTWRDVKLILAASARKNDAANTGWLTGASKYGASGNYEFNHEYGFGVVDAKAAVDLAAGWTNLPTFIETAPASASPDLRVPDASGGTPGATVTSTVQAGGGVEFIEFVEVNVVFNAPAFRDLKMELVSPSNTVSTLAVSLESPVKYGLVGGYRFGSARHLGENPAGTWTLRLADHAAGGAVSRLKSWNLVFYGHRSTPAAPTISSVSPGQRELTVQWSAPSVVGSSAVASYDVRHILSSATDKSDGNWTVRTAAWTSGPLQYMLTGLADSTEYDVQVRAVNSRGAGAWSATARATTGNGPPSPVGTLAARTLRVGEAAVTVDVSGAFRDPEGDALTYGAVSSAPGVARVAVSGSSVEVSPVSGGTATVTVKATDLSGSNTAAEQQFSVRVRNRRGVSVDPVSLSVTEGGSGTYDVALEAEPSASVTVTPSVPSGTDVTVSPQSLTFGTTGWGTAQPVTVSAAEDTDAVSDAPVVIRHTVSGGDYGSVTASSVTVTVLENDASAVSTSDVSVSEGGGDAVFEVSLSVAGTSDVLVDYATSDVSAEAGSDYTAVSGTLTFPQGSTAPREIRVSILDDALDETEEETFALTLRNARNGLLAGGGTTLRAVGTIRDDDDPAVVASFARSSYEAPEGGSAPVHVILDRDPERTVTVPLESIHRGGASSGDYAGVPSEVTFSSGRLIAPFLFLAVDDGDDDDGEAVEVRIGSPLPPGVSPGASAVLAIRDNDGGGNPGGGSPGGGSPGGGGGGGGGGGPPPGGGGGGPGGGGGTPPGGGSGGPPPSGGGGGGPPRAAITTGADCGGTLCRARTGERVSFEDTGSGTVRSRLWDFGDGRKSLSRTTSQVWSEPGFYTVTLRVSDGTVESTASLTFLVEAAEPAGACVADDRTLCLGDSRYAVTVEWRTAGGESGAARVVHEGTNDSGLFHFFEPGDNWEVLIKVLDGCPVNGHVWMYAASTTDLGYTIEITDTATGMAREYRNEPGMPAPAITDVTAFRESCDL